MAAKEETRPLDERNREILKLIIRSYVLSGEPVGSRTLAKSMEWRFSPATIRNIMADLEEAGYLAQPHTSAGRVPSEKGYRFYVDHLADSGRLTKSDERYISKMLSETDSPEEVMSRASMILSTISKNVGIVIAPPMGLTVLKHIEFLDLSDGKILVIFVSTAGQVQRKLIRVNERYTQDELDKAGRYLVEKFSGKTLTDIRNELLRMMQAERSLFDRMLSLLQSWGETLTQPSAAENIYLQGATNIINQPEFADVERMRMLFQMFEEKGRLVKILNECISSSRPEGVTIAIGSELGVPDLRDFTLITASYATADHTTGFLGIIGPTRMEYERGISIVEYLGRIVGEMINA
ncbi:MAG TPA: heat-inducible transcriptional repressor HrcA [Terriglobia bacterium]|nr:heat-inducible transcriptional repressor HrcA [Terriglobia bacterium]